MLSLEIFRAHKKEVVAAWVEAVFATYPFETTGFLRTKQDPFGNPVAHMTREAASTLFDAVAGEDMHPPTVKNALDRFIKLRAVQKFLPSQSLAVIHAMKPILREQVLPKMQDVGQLAAYLEAESRLDSLALLAFDMYCEARETVAEARIKEIRNQHAQLARWAQRLEDGGKAE
ncbi:MAG: RsbRD N-terminal domain-containing protein [Desulfovibrio sp.]|nr:RsbRD N-terminal domain-containing protein [Desulfovibrio sp.]